MNSDWYDIGDAQARKRASKSLGERDSKSNSTVIASPSIAPASNPSKKRTREDTDNFTNLRTDRFLSTSLSVPLTGAIDSSQFNQVRSTATYKSRRRHSLELEGEFLTASLVLRQEEQKILDNFDDSADVDLDNIPTAAALASSVFRSSSQRRKRQ